MSNPTNSQVKTVKAVAKDNGIEISTKTAKRHAKTILENVVDYYESGDRDESTREDDFYYDVKEYFSI